jgi:DNA ligase 1
LVQPKYDGLRCQIHKISGDMTEVEERVWYGRLNKDESVDMFGGGSNADNVKLFTRNLEDITEMFPEIVSAVNDLNVDSVILDSEIVGWDGKKQEFLSYQDTMTRRRKYGVNERKESIPVSAFIFDVLYHNGVSLLATTSGERFDTLNLVIDDGVEFLKRSPCDLVDSTEVLRGLFDKYVEMGLEGVIVKDFDSRYQAGVRNFEWIKIKKSIDSNLVDSVDLVVLGYYFGSGKRSKFGIGAILGGVYNPDSEMYESVTKIGTGITDLQWGIIKERLGEIKVDVVPKNVLIEDILKPDVYVSPDVVITVEADEISVNRSSEKVAKGLSLRFPRLIEFDRQDKGKEDVTTVEELLSMLKK